MNTKTSRSSRTARAARRSTGSEQLVGSVRPHAERPVEPRRVPRPQALAPGAALGGSAAVATMINLVAGIWLVIAPWVLGYTSITAQWNDVACGVAITLLALARLSGASRLIWASWLNCMIGIWLIVATFTIDLNPTEWINDVIVGAVVALLALWSASAGADAAENAGTLDPRPAEEIIAPEPYPRASARRPRRPGSLPH